MTWSHVKNLFCLSSSGLTRRSMLFIALFFCCSLQAEFKKTNFLSSDEPIVLEAAESVEFDDAHNIMKARKNVTLTQKDSTLWADVMHGFFKKDPITNKKDLIRLEAFGHVKIKMPDKIATSDEGFYDLEKDLIFLKHNVKITDKKNQLVGEYATIDMKTGQSKLFNTLTPDSFEKGLPDPKKRIKILLIPEKKDKESKSI